MWDLVRVVTSTLLLSWDIEHVIPLQSNVLRVSIKSHKQSDNHAKTKKCLIHKAVLLEVDKYLTIVYWHERRFIQIHVVKVSFPASVGKTWAYIQLSLQ